MGPFCLGLKGMVPILCFGEALYHFLDHFFPFFWIHRLILGTIYTIFAFKRAIQISVRLKDVQVLEKLIIPFTLSDFFN